MTQKNRLGPLTDDQIKEELLKRLDGHCTLFNVGASRCALDLNMTIKQKAEAYDHALVDVSIARLLAHFVRHMGAGAVAAIYRKLSDTDPEILAAEWRSDVAWAAFQSSRMGEPESRSKP